MTLSGSSKSSVVIYSATFRRTSIGIGWSAGPFADGCRLSDELP